MTVISEECFLVDAPKYVVGGTIPPDSPVYQEREADSQLLELCLTGQFAYILTSRQMGKSSLMARTAIRLRSAGLLPAIVDLTSIGSRDVTAEQWYLGVLLRIETFCSPETDLLSWWAEHATIPLTQRFTKYITEVLVGESTTRIVIFVDEIDSTLGMAFTDDFFAAVRAF
jgi:hypothetical protein